MVRVLCGGAGDERIAAFVENTPASDTLEGLRRLFSYRGAEWRWTRGGSPDSSAYILTRPPAARALAARLRG